MSSLRLNPNIFICFLYSIIVSGDSAANFIKMFMLMCFECTLAKTRMGFGRVTFPIKGPYVIQMAKS